MKPAADEEHSTTSDEHHTAKTLLSARAIGRARGRLSLLTGRHNFQRNVVFYVVLIDVRTFQRFWSIINSADAAMLPSARCYHSPAGSCHRRRSRHHFDRLLCRTSALCLLDGHFPAVVIIIVVQAYDTVGTLRHLFNLSLSHERVARVLNMPL